MTIEYTRCCPSDFLALCHICYRRLLNPQKGQQYYDHYLLCKDGKYEKFLQWRDFHGDDLLERLRHVQVPEDKEKAVVVQDKKLDNK